VKRIAARLTPLSQIAAVCLLWLGAVFALPHNNAPSRGSPERLRSVRPESRFVFADFDGDQKPDLALVETQNQRSTRSSYAIRVKFSHGVESAIPVNGPVGGLRVAARDVNGDDNLDLIVTSNLDGGFIEVLLNDGSGNFSMAPPGAYAGLESGDSGSLDEQPSSHPDLATLASLRSPHEQGLMQGPQFLRSGSSDSYPRAGADPVVGRHALSCQGRSPPARISLS